MNKEISETHGNLKVFCKEDCGNAPRKQVLKSFNIAFASGNVEAVLDAVSDDIVWERVGDCTIRGKHAFADALNRYSNQAADELRLLTIITHGNEASANGILKFNGQYTWAFCDVYRFAGFTKTAKIKQITSYAIQVDD